jgi:hypothetical protein
MEVVHNGLARAPDYQAAVFCPLYVLNIDKVRQELPFSG